MTLPQVDELSQIIKAAREELSQIRKECPHPSYSVGRWEWAPGHGNICRICEDCVSPIEGIIDEEVRAYMDKQSKVETGSSNITLTIEDIKGIERCK